MKKLLLLSAFLIFACTDDEGNPCIYQPTLTTEAVTNITETSATLNGTIDITSENCETPNNTEQGFVYSTEIQPTTDDIQVNVNGTNISTTIVGLEPNTTYYVRSFVLNNFGEFYGNEIEFTTIAGQVIINTLEVNNITQNSASTGGQIISDGNTTITSIGVCWSINPNPSTDSNLVNSSENSNLFQCLIEELTPNTQYYVRAFATNEFGVYYGNEFDFKTICEFDFDEDGICDSDDNDDDNDEVPDSIDCEPYDSTINQYVTEIEDGIDNNCNGEIDEGFENEGTLIDTDGNIYDWIVIGTQRWTLQNVKTITYTDGTPIPQVTDSEEWANLTTGAWCYFDNDPSSNERLFNWFAVAGIHDEDALENPSLRKQFVPDGWHIPSLEEWNILENYLIDNGFNYDGTNVGNKIAKALSSIEGWNLSDVVGAPGYNQNENNSSNFNAFPVGVRYSYAEWGYSTFYDDSLGGQTWWWSTSQDSGIHTHYFKGLSYEDEYFGVSSADNDYGLSVRLIKD